MKITAVHVLVLAVAAVAVYVLVKGRRPDQQPARPGKNAPQAPPGYGVYAPAPGNPGGGSGVIQQLGGGQGIAQGVGALTNLGFGIWDRLSQGDDTPPDDGSGDYLA